VLNGSQGTMIERFGHGNASGISSGYGTLEKDDETTLLEQSNLTDARGAPASRYDL